MLCSWGEWGRGGVGWGTGRGAVIDPLGKGQRWGRACLAGEVGHPGGGASWRLRALEGWQGAVREGQRVAEWARHHVVAAVTSRMVCS